MVMKDYVSTRQRLKMASCWKDKVLLGISWVILIGFISVLFI